MRVPASLARGACATREPTARRQRCLSGPRVAQLPALQDELLQHVPGFEDAIRRFILDTMQITCARPPLAPARPSAQRRAPRTCRYQSIPEAHLCASLNVNSEVLTGLVSARGWAREEGNLVRVKLNDDNTAKPRKLDEGDMLRGADQMSKILSSTWT